MNAKEVIADNRIVPVVVVDDPDRALKLTEIFLRTDLRCVEITLRTPNALACIEAVVNRFPEAVTGAGSIVTPKHLTAALQAGIKFAVSPGASDELLEAAHSTPLFPGAATPSEVMQLKSKGYTAVKFFPAEILGGVKAIRAISEPISGVDFFPTGGISEANLADYLSFDRICCVGGSWLAPRSDVENDAWDAIEARCISLQRILAELKAT